MLDGKAKDRFETGAPDGVVADFLLTMAPGALPFGWSDVPTCRAWYLALFGVCYASSSMGFWCKSPTQIKRKVLACRHRIT